MSAIISSKTTNTFRFLCLLQSSILVKTSSMSFEYSIHAVESLKCLIPAFFLLLIKNSYFDSDKSLA